MGVSLGDLIWPRDKQTVENRLKTSLTTVANVAMSINTDLYTSAVATNSINIDGVNGANLSQIYQRNTVEINATQAVQTITSDEVTQALKQSASQQAEALKKGFALLPSSTEARNIDEFFADVTTNIQRSVASKVSAYANSSNAISVRNSSNVVITLVSQENMVRAVADQVATAQMATRTAQDLVTSVAQKAKVTSEGINLGELLGLPDLSGALGPALLVGGGLLALYLVLQLTRKPSAQQQAPMPMWAGPMPMAPGAQWSQQWMQPPAMGPASPYWR
jgi:predicted Zn-dependent protease